jgi:hypothetical protein
LGLGLPLGATVKFYIKVTEREQGEEMAQTMYARMNKQINEKKIILKPSKKQRKTKRKKIK